MKKLDKLGRVFTVILSVLYFPMAFISWLMQMVSVDAMNATNPVYIALIKIVCAIAFLMPLLCVACVVVAVLLRKRGCSVLSFLIQLAPLVIFLLSFALLAITDVVPKVL